MGDRTLGQVVEALGSTMVVGTVGRLDGEIASIVVATPADEVRLEPASLVVACGYVPDSPAFDDLCTEAARVAVAGIVIKGGSSAHPRVSIVRVDRRAEWGQVIALLRTATEFGIPRDGAEDSLFGLAEMLRSILGGPVVILDPGWHLLCYSSGHPQDTVRSATIFGRRTPSSVVEELNSAGLLDRLRRGDVVEILDGQFPSVSHRWGVAARVGGEVLATIWVQPERAGDLDHLETSLRRAATTAALCLLKRAVAASGPNAPGDAAFSALLRGGRTEGAVTREFSARGQPGYVLVGFQSQYDRYSDKVSAAWQLPSIIRSYCDAFRIPVQAACVNDTAYALLSCQGPGRRADVVSQVSDMHSRLRDQDMLAAVISDAFDELAKVVDTRKKVDELLALAGRCSWSGLADGAAMPASWRIERMKELSMVHPELFSGPVAALEKYDRDSGTDFISTLRSYFRHAGRVREVADELSVHINTIRYRVRRLQELVDLDLNDPDERLLAELQLRLKR